MPGSSPDSQLISAGFALLTALLQQIIANQGTTAPAVPVITWNAYLETILAEQQDVLQRLQRIENFLGLMSTQEIGYLVDIKALVTGLAGGSISVTLPPTPPAGWSGTPEDIANAVWQFQLGAGPTRAGDELDSCAATAQFAASINEARRIFTKPSWFVSGDWGNSGQSEPNLNYCPDDPDFTTILPSDATMEDWITRVYGALYFQYQDDGMISFRPTGQGWRFILDLTPAQFQVLRAAAALKSSGVAPVWPGLDLVTLGSETALADQLSVDGPMHGVIVALDSAPSVVAEYSYDDLTSYAKIGAITFVNDNGQAEHVFALSFDKQVYSPSKMTSATRCIVKLRSGVSGTIQPWSIT